MERFLLIGTLTCVLLAGCNRLETAARPATGPIAGYQAGTAQILGMVAGAGRAESDRVQLGRWGPTARVNQDGYFDFLGVRPGCYNLRMRGEARVAPVTLGGNYACVEDGQTLVLTLVLGSS